MTCHVTHEMTYPDVAFVLTHFTGAVSFYEKTQTLTRFHIKRTVAAFFFGGCGGLRCWWWLWGFEVLVVVVGVCGGLWGFVVVCGGLWWFVGVCGGLWGFVVVCGGLWWFVGVCGGLWGFVKVRGRSL